MPGSSRGHGHPRPRRRGQPDVARARLVRRAGGDARPSPGWRDRGRGEDRHAVVATRRRDDALGGDHPEVGLIPTMPCRPAGTRPDPAVSVPIAMSTRPSATATAEPGAGAARDVRSGRRESRTAPYGLRVPTRPVANWSRLVLPMHHRAGRPQRGDRRRRRLGQVGEARAGGGGRHPGHVDVVLDRQHRAAQRRSARAPIAACSASADASARDAGDPDLRPVGRLDRGDTTARRSAAVMRPPPLPRSGELARRGPGLALRPERRAWVAAARRSTSALSRGTVRARRARRCRR